MLKKATKAPLPSIWRWLVVQKPTIAAHGGIEIKRMSQEQSAIIERLRSESVLSKNVPLGWAMPDGPKVAE
jgi:hypothetical protein